jgi:hypothetical protein
MEFNRNINAIVSIFLMKFNKKRIIKMKLKNMAMAVLFLLAAGQSGAAETTGQNMPDVPTCKTGEQLVQMDIEGKPWYYCGQKAQCPEGESRLSGQYYGEGCYKSFEPCGENDVLVQDGSKYVCKTPVNAGNIQNENAKLGRSNPNASGNAEYFLGTPAPSCGTDKVLVQKSGLTGATECMKTADLTGETTQGLNNKCPKGKFFRWSRSKGMWGCMDTAGSMDNALNTMKNWFSWGSNTAKQSDAAQSDSEKNQ